MSIKLVPDAHPDMSRAVRALAEYDAGREHRQAAVAAARTEDEWEEAQELEREALAEVKIAYYVSLVGFRPVSWAGVSLLVESDLRRLIDRYVSEARTREDA